VDYVRVYQTAPTVLNDPIANESVPEIIYPIEDKIVRFRYSNTTANIPLKVAVYNVSGVNVFAQNFIDNGMPNKLNLSALNSGVYFIRFNSQNSKVCKVILK
jgi:hypothetical protein